ncbi:hypothetical protein JCM11641_007912 [Rhodosporidiobolus odoratus]
MSDHTRPPPTSATNNRMVKVKRRPARKQQAAEKKQLEQTGQTYNVWYHKWAGGDKYDSYNNQEKSSTRVNIKLDQGYTRADGDGTQYVCMFFARGCCPLGHECSYLHRLPSPTHRLPDAALDVFGREKHSGYRDDMGGVGSFNRQNRTLYVGKLRETRNTAEVVESHFEEFGEIERIKILTNRGVAFVTYVSELNAQFAKEAMMHQSLDSDEVLNVRWATEDPNPVAARQEAARLVNQGEEGIAASLTKNPDFVKRVRELDELEGIVEPLPELEEQVEQEQEQEQDGEGGRETKRARIEPPSASPSQSPQEGGESATASPATAVAAPSGILSAHAVDSLKFMAALREQRQASSSGDKVQVPVAKKPTSAASALGALADYGSDSD